MMKNYYVTTDNKGYIDNWSTISMEGLTQIRADSVNFGYLECVKVVNGVAVLDEIKQGELLNTPAPLSEIEQLKKENEILKRKNISLDERCNATDSAVLELTDLILNGGE